MPNTTTDAKVFCPYFARVKQNKKALVCEGQAKGSRSVTQEFATQRQCTQWVREVCQTHRYCDRCLLAKAIEGKYTD